MIDRETWVVARNESPGEGEIERWCADRSIDMEALLSTADDTFADVMQELNERASDPNKQQSTIYSAIVSCLTAGISAGQLGK
jgi:hypothetical protein